MTAQQSAEPAPVATAEAVRGGTSPRHSGGREGSLVAYLFLAPYLILFTIFVVIPAGYGLFISLHRWSFFGDPVFLGGENYLRLLGEGSQVGAAFWQSMRATGIFTLYSVPLLIVLPFLVASVLNLRVRGRTFFRAVFFSPYVLGVAVVGILWRFLGDPNIGAINFLLERIGLPSSIAWTTSLP